MAPSDGPFQYTLAAASNGGGRFLQSVAVYGYGSDAMQIAYVIAYVQPCRDRGKSPGNEAATRTLKTGRWS